MASQTIRRTNPSSKVLSCKKTECLICFQAGNPNYVNHRIKDASGKVVCPTLLKQKCHICKQTGHTPKYCTISKMKNTFVNALVTLFLAFVIASFLLLNTMETNEDTYSNEKRQKKQEMYLYLYDFITLMFLMLLFCY